MTLKELKEQRIVRIDQIQIGHTIMSISVESETEPWDNCKIKEIKSIIEPHMLPDGSMQITPQLKVIIVYTTIKGHNRTTGGGIKWSA